MWVFKLCTDVMEASFIVSPPLQNRIMRTMLGSKCAIHSILQTQSKNNVDERVSLPICLGILFVVDLIPEAVVELLKVRLINDRNQSIV